MKTTTAKPAFNLFASATVVEPKATAAKKEKEKIFVAGIENDLIRYNEIKTEESNLKTEKEMIGGRLREIGKTEWLKKLSIQKCRPDSFQLVNGAGKVMVIVEDRYKKIEEAKENELQAFPGVLETTTVFTINPAIFGKPGVGQALSDAIMNAEGLSEEDKRLLILKEEVTSVKKGTIDRLLTFQNYEQLFYLIEPTVALK